ncbi:MAG: MBOAT family protein [Methylomonas sp.]|nr:MBOAT family protein [Methylomonas sp.]
MLFNTFEFIFIYLPITLLGFFMLAKKSSNYAATWLAIASLVFYGSWDYRYIPLLLGSITFNYWMAIFISKIKKPSKKRLLILAIATNLALLAYYKYANFFLSSLSGVLKLNIEHLAIILPIGISFFTFTQIAFLVDTYQNKVREYKFTHYVLFVTYFPHLIAGPVLHHKEMMPQFAEKINYSPSADNFAIGTSIFVIGLIKKVIIADSISPLANPIFQIGAHPGLIEAWIGALAYAMQLYFDFSGYSDMAIGLSRMFGVKLPLNFNSPYKAENIIDFWRRWHMTLSRFLKDYLYIPLGGNRYGVFSRYRNLFITMLLGGLWHGAGWTYVIWGGLHGIYLGINHAWRALCETKGWQENRGKLAIIAARSITFTAVLSAWVFFRSPDFSTAIDILSGMTGLNGISLPAWTKAHLGWLGEAGWSIKFEGIPYIDFGSMGIPILILALGITWLAPNTQEIMMNTQPCLESVTPEKSAIPIKWQLSNLWLSFISAGFLICILNMNNVSEFLYFQF